MEFNELQLEYQEYFISNYFLNLFSSYKELRAMIIVFPKNLKFYFNK